MGEGAVPGGCALGTLSPQSRDRMQQAHRGKGASAHGERTGQLPGAQSLLPLGFCVFTQDTLDGVTNFSFSLPCFSLLS